MSAIPGTFFYATGASGTQGFLSPKDSWRVYILPQGAYASQASSGALITVDSSDIAARFAANQWVQVGLSPSNIRQVTAVGGNSFSVNSAVTVSVGDRIYIIGSTQPTVNGSSATYTVPASFIYQRDDNTADRYTNSMVTTSATGLVQFYAENNTFDAIIQDGNQSIQGFVHDIVVGSSATAQVFNAAVTFNAGIGVTGAALFGNTVTVNGAFGTTGWATLGSTVTMHAALGVTGTAKFGSTVTLNSHLGVTGYALIGSTLTVNGALGVTGWATFGSSITASGALGVTGWATFGASVTVAGALGVTGAATIGSSALVSGHLTAGRLKLRKGTTHSTAGYSLTAGWGGSAFLTVSGNRDSAGRVAVTCNGSPTINPFVVLTFSDGAWETPPAVFVSPIIGATATVAGLTQHFWIPIVGSASGVSFMYTGLPEDDKTYEFVYLCVGISG